MVKDPCAYCGGTGAIRCNHCGGTGINKNSSLLDDQCHGCKGTGREICQRRRGTGEWRPIGIAESQEQRIKAGLKNIPKLSNTEQQFIPGWTIIIDIREEIQDES